MSLAVLRPALFATLFATLLAGCTSSPASSSDNTSSSDSSAPASDPAPAPMTDTTSNDMPSNDTPGMISNGQTFSMQPGGQVTLSDRSTLRYVSVQSDSRCKPGQQCIQAGNAVVGFQWQSTPGGSEAFTLNSAQQPKTRELRQNRLTLVSLAFGEEPQVQLRVDSTN